jgi:hypothetical protein
MSPISKRALAVAAAAFFSLSAHAAPLDCVNGVNGSGLCEVPPGMNRVTIEAWGGGGGGAGSNTGAVTGGGGGGGGSYCGATFTVTPGDTLTITAGVGGPKGNPLLNGLPGVPSSVTGGGISGMVAEAGEGGATIPSGGLGGSTISCSASAATKFAGGAGYGDFQGGGGGGSATSTVQGNNGFLGVGGAGEGTGGAGGALTLGNGNLGMAPGGGGGGGYSGGAFSGGWGGDGQVIMHFAFAPPPVVPATPASIPTLSEWGVIAVSSLLAMFGIAGIRRKR